MTRRQAALTLISTIVGGGIVSLPDALYFTGIITGIILCITMAIQTTYSAKLYLVAKEMLPGQPESLFEIGFMLFKRNSIFVISAIIIFNSFGLMLIYFILFGDTLAGLVINMSSVTKDDFMGQRAAYVIIITALLLPLAVKKQLEELKIVSVLLFVSIFSFIVITCVQLSIEGVEKYNADYVVPRDFEFFDEHYYFPKADVKFISGFSVILVSFGCQQNLFPIYSELKKKTTSELVSSFGLACAAVLVLYVTLAVIGIYMFGSDIGMESTILKNVARECTDHPGDPCPWESIVLRSMFMVVIACHIPFLFFSGKEGTLIVIDELVRRSISRALQEKLNALAEDEAMAVPLIDKDIGQVLENIDQPDEQLLRYGKSEALKFGQPALASRDSNEPQVAASQIVPIKQQASFTARAGEKEQPSDGLVKSINEHDTKHHTQEHGQEMQSNRMSKHVQNIVQLRSKAANDQQSQRKSRREYLQSFKSNANNSERVSFVRETASLINLAMMTSKLHQEENELNRQNEGLAYKDMKDCHYYSATIFLFLFEAGMAIAIPDVEIMFNFVSAIAASCLGFLFPAVFFLGAERQFQVDEETKKRNSYHRVMAYFHLVLGIFIFIVCFTQSILSCLDARPAE